MRARVKCVAVLCGYVEVWYVEVLVYVQRLRVVVVCAQPSLNTPPHVLFCDLVLMRVVWSGGRWNGAVVVDYLIQLTTRTNIGLVFFSFMCLSGVVRGVVAFPPAFSSLPRLQKYSSVTCFASLLGFGRIAPALLVCIC